ncbi:MAG: hypothetical protein EA397_12615 [Deltaproteobacteria bacterium]|nr:MAG: hypothetical protein EA397_12615 [Deltaproteobacteria bacterium]
MYVTSLRTDGLRFAHDAAVDLPSRLVHLADGPANLALFDALELFRAACEAEHLESALSRLDVVDPFEDLEVSAEHGLPEQISFAHGDAESLLRPDGTRTIKVRVDLALDPLLYGTLREQALRDPRLVTALGDATASITVGWVFTNDLHTASIARLQVRIGDVSFPSAGNERPRWLAPWLRDIAGRFRRITSDDLDVVAERLLEAAFSSDPVMRQRYHTLRQALEAPPFNLGRLELVHLRGVVTPCFGPELVRPRLVGRRGAELLQIATAVLLDQPDVLLIERIDPADAPLLAWLEAATQGEDAVLEQVLIAQGAPR